MANQNASVEIRKPSELRLLGLPPAAVRRFPRIRPTRAERDPETPPRFADMLAELEAHAQAALDPVRNIARGIDPPLLADFGPREAVGTVLTISLPWPAADERR